MSFATETKRYYSRAHWLSSHQYLYTWLPIFCHVIQKCKYFTGSLIWSIICNVVRWLIFCICVLFLQRTASVDQELTKFVQPQIVGIGESFDLDQLYIVCEGTVLCTIPHQSIVDSIVALLSSFYIFNMLYKDSKAILSFSEQTLMGIRSGNTLLSVNTLFNDISDL